MTNEEAYDLVENLALIEIEDGIVHLISTWNPDAEIYDENGDLEEDIIHVQQEDYGWEGWQTPQTNSELVNDFWQVWDDCNADNAGGIDLDDGCTPEDVLDLKDSLPNVIPSDISDLPDGRYMVVLQSL